MVQFQPPRFPSHRPPGSVGRSSFDPGLWWDRFLTADPDFARMRIGAWSLLSTVVAILATWALSHWTHQPMILMLPGIMLAMMDATVVTDPTPRAQRLTTLLLPVPGALALALGTVLAPYQWLNLGVFLVVIFWAVFIRRFGPRYLAFGFVMYVSYFQAIFFRATSPALPWLVGSMLVGSTAAYVVRFVLIRDDAARSLAHSLDALPRTVGLALLQLSKVIQAPEWGPRQVQAIRSSVHAINEVALIVEDRLDPAIVGAIAPNLTVSELRLRTYEIELAFGRVATLVRRMAQEAPPEAIRLATALTLTQAREAIRGSAATLTASAEHGLPSELPRALSELLVAVRALRAPAQPGTAMAPEPPPLPDPPHAEEGMNLATRQAIQATLATGLAMVAGLALSPSRWYWAVIGAYIMFIRATTLGETLVRGWQRIVGTAIGVTAGILLASLMQGHTAIEFTIVFASIFAGYYLMRVSYIWLVIGITLLLASLYSILDRFTPALMLLRLEETMVGCAIGALVAAVILPMPTRRKVRAGMSELLRLLAELVEARGSDQIERTSSIEGFRKVDRKLKDLQLAAQPLMGSLFGVVYPVEQEEVHLLTVAVFFGRYLVSSGHREFAGASRMALQAAAAEVSHHALAIAQALEDDRSVEPFQPISAHPVAPATEGEAELTIRDPFYWLDHLDDTLGALGRVINAEAQRKQPRA